jgi:hypothetical protein
MKNVTLIKPPYVSTQLSAIRKKYHSGAVVSGNSTFFDIAKLADTLNKRGKPLPAVIFDELERGKSTGMSLENLYHLAQSYPDTRFYIADGQLS